METSNQSQFKAGDVVSLKSLGGNMTIAADRTVGVYKQYEVKWLDGKGRMQTAILPEDTIQHSSTFQFFPLAPQVNPLPFAPAPMWTPQTSYVPNNGTTQFDKTGVIAVNSSSQADGCSDPGDVHQ